MFLLRSTVSYSNFKLGTWYGLCPPDVGWIASSALLQGARWPGLAVVRSVDLLFP